MLKNLQAKSKRPFVVLIQGDHGPEIMMSKIYNSQPTGINTDPLFLTGTFGIFSSYYFSDHQYDSLYQGASPVNSFRIIFNKYFKAGLPILEDKQFYTPYESYFLTNDVTDKIDK